MSQFSFASLQQSHKLKSMKSRRTVKSRDSKDCKESRKGKSFASLEASVENGKSSKGSQEMKGVQGRELEYIDFRKKDERHLLGELARLQGELSKVLGHWGRGTGIQTLEKYNTVYDSFQVRVCDILQLQCGVLSSIKTSIDELARRQYYHNMQALLDRAARGTRLQETQFTNQLQRQVITSIANYNKLKEFQSRRLQLIESIETSAVNCYNELKSIHYRIVKEEESAKDSQNYQQLVDLRAELAGCRKMGFSPARLTQLLEKRQHHLLAQLSKYLRLMQFLLEDERSSSNQFLALTRLFQKNVVSRVSLVERGHSIGTYSVAELQQIERRLIRAQKQGRTRLKNTFKQMADKPAQSSKVGKNVKGPYRTKSNAKAESSLSFLLGEQNNLKGKKGSSKVRYKGAREWKPSVSFQDDESVQAAFEGLPLAEQKELLRRFFEIDSGHKSEQRRFKSHLSQRVDFSDQFQQEIKDFKLDELQFLRGEELLVFGFEVDPQLVEQRGKGVSSFKKL